MADPSIFAAIRIPTTTLIALDNRPLHFALQPYHHLVRLLHVLARAAFFGGIGLLDFRLMGWRGTVPLRSFAEHVLRHAKESSRVVGITPPTPLHAPKPSYA